MHLPEQDHRIAGERVEAGKKTDADGNECLESTQGSFFVSSQCVALSVDSARHLCRISPPNSVSSGCAKHACFQ